jgi:multidrug efflux pump subunit AcrA (membrane-fusion protein)
LPDGKNIPGTLVSSIPTVDPSSQTQKYVIRMDDYQPVPENLVARVSFIRKVKTNAVSLPQQAILTDEQQSEFWIMKMVGDSMAEKVSIKKGIETSGRVEILSPELTTGDRILLTGNYGLPDTARVKVVSTNE